MTGVPLTHAQVPPMIIQMLSGKDICKKYDLSSVRFVFSGAAPLGEETMAALEQLIPSCVVAQAYGEFCP